MKNKCKEIQKQSCLGSVLSDWYEENQRPFPWRQTRDPYKIWVSEVMLQQTRASVVIEYYLRWMKQFESVDSLARAPFDRVLKCWEGLGYYARVRNLHQAAQLVVEKHAGVVPNDMTELMGLPGIGKYTAGAILSIAYNREYPVVDANVKRVFSRIFDLELEVESRAAKKLFWEKAADLIPEKRARSFNQGLMELGALVCTSGEPKCDKCPWSCDCLAKKNGSVNLRPVKKAKRKIVRLQVSLGVLVNQDRILVQKRPDEGLMAGLWEFPGGKIESGETAEDALVREFSEELALDIVCGEKIGEFRHSYTHFSVTLHAYWCRLKDCDQAPILHAATKMLWVFPREFSELTFPAGDRKLIRFLEKNGLWKTK